MEKFESIHDMALKFLNEQVKNKSNDNIPKETTIFILGSKGVGKTTIINRFLDRDELPKPTLALEYSFGRRSLPGQSVQKQVCNVWELGCLTNANQLVEVPIRSHGIENFAALIVLDLSQPERIWIELERGLSGLKESYKQNIHDSDIIDGRNKTRERVGVNHVDLNTLELFPFPIVIIGGKYDVFQDMDPAIKKHVCRCLRSIAHTIGAALIFYSFKISALAKTVRDTMNHFAFGSPANPFRGSSLDYNGPLVIAFGSDSWEKMGLTPSNSDRIGIMFNTHVPQVGGLDTQLPPDPAKDVGFREAYIDEIRVLKDEELMRLIKDLEMKAKFETISI